jgi:hypothetical protein
MFDLCAEVMFVLEEIVARFDVVGAGIVRPTGNRRGGGDGLICEGSCDGGHI